MSLSIGAHVYKKLSDSTELAKLVSDKIYAISTKTETSFPFVIYKRNSLTPEYTKDRYGTGDTVSDGLTGEVFKKEWYYYAN